MIYSHSGNLGDIIWSLPVIRAMGAGTLHLLPGNIPNVIRKYKNGPVYPEYEDRLTYNDYLMIAPLLDCQEYITDTKFTMAHKFHTDLDEFRGTVGSAFTKNFLETFAETFSLTCDEEFKKPWLKVEPKKIAQFVVTRTPRYQSNNNNPNLNWEKIIEDFKLSENGTFIGLVNEHESFQNQFGIKIPHYKITSFLEMAQVIAGSECFIGNQTLAYSIAQGLGQNTILELRSVDCYIEREGSLYF